MNKIVHLTLNVLLSKMILQLDIEKIIFFVRLCHLDVLPIYFDKSVEHFNTTRAAQC